MPIGKLTIYGNVDLLLLSRIRMNTKLLRQKILDLAIRGKLTQQLKSDGNTADLLKEISSASHPERSAKGAKSKDPGTIIPLDKSEAPFEIPANWEWVRLNQITELIEDCPHSTACDEGAGYPLIRTPNIGFGHLILEGVHRVSEDVYRRRNLRATPQPNDLIFAREAPAGNIAVIKDGQEVCLGQRTVLVRPLRNILCSYYLAYYILSSISQKRLVECSGGSTVAHVNLSVFRSYEVPLPPLAEQQRIVAKIEEAFAEIDSIENNKELLKTHIKQTRQKILDLAIHGKLVPQNKADEPASILLERITRDNPHYEKLTDIPFEIPESWEWVKLGDVGKWQSGTTPSKSNSSYYKDGTIPWLNTGDLNDGIICEIPKKVTEKALAETSLRLNEAGSVCIAMYGATIGKIGILSMPATTNQACCVCNNLKNFVNQMWLFYFLKNHKQEFIEAGFGGAQPNISKEKITATLFPLPPLAEQKRIVDRIEEIFASLDEISLHLV